MVRKESLPYKLLRSRTRRAGDVTLQTKVGYDLLTWVVVGVLKVSPYPGIVQEGCEVGGSFYAGRENARQPRCFGLEFVVIC